MPKLQINAGKDHIAKYVSATPLITGITELIWNSLDANATVVDIVSKRNELNGFVYIDVIDNGHGCTYLQAKNAFQYIGNSYKRNREKTKNDKRSLHGSEGRGRYKALSIGNYTSFHSVYLDESDSLKKEFTVNLSNDDLTTSDISEEKICKDQSVSTGVSIRISGIENKTGLFNENNIDIIQEIFAYYYSLYSDFEIKIEDQVVDLSSKIKKIYPETGLKNIVIPKTNGEDINLSLKIIEWDFAKTKGDKKASKKLNLCNKDGCPLYQTSLGVNTEAPNISLYVMSDYISKLNNDGLLSEINEDTQLIIKEARSFIKEYLNIERTEKRKKYIEQLKLEKIYPYKDDEISSGVVNAEKELFDVIAVKIDECLPKFTSQDKKNKKLTFALIKEAIATKSSKLKNILREVCSLSDEDIEKFDKILEYTTLPNIITASNEVIDRIRFLTELREFVAGDISKRVKERSQLHKIIEKEQWIFGEQYKPGTSDKSLRTVLKEHIKKLGREHLINEETLNEITNDSTPALKLIPDLCLWSAIPKGSKEKREHLFVELKRPSQNATTKEKQQINDYAYAVTNDKRFSKENTTWKFLLIVTEIDDRLKQEKQDNSKSLNGLYGKGENFEVYIYEWSYLIEQKEGELRRLNELLNINLDESPEELSYLKTMHAEYIPE